MEKQIVKSFADQHSYERQDKVIPKPDILQLGTTFKSWLQEMEELDPKPETQRARYASGYHRDVNEVEGSFFGEGGTQEVITGGFVETKPRQPKATLLRQLLKQDERNYKTKFVPKRGSNELREVKAPMNALKKLQVMLLRYMYRHTTVAEEAHGFVRKKGNWTLAAEVAAEMKKGQRFSILTQDLRKAFSSITETQVRKVLKDTGLTGFALHAATRVSTYEGILATGSPSSPHILNLLFKQIDTKLGKWAKQQGGIYRRYADDCTIALPTWNTKRMKAAREILRRQFAKLGIDLHPDKTKITRLGLDSDSAEIVGIATQQQKCTRPRRLRRKLRGIARAVHKELFRGNEEQAERVFQRASGLAAYFSGEFKAIREAKNKKRRQLRFTKA